MRDPLLHIFLCTACVAPFVCLYFGWCNTAQVKFFMKLTIWMSSPLRVNKFWRSCKAAPACRCRSESANRTKNFLQDLMAKQVWRQVPWDQWLSHGLTHLWFSAKSLSPRCFWPSTARGSLACPNRRWLSWLKIRQSHQTLGLRWLLCLRWLSLKICLATEKALGIASKQKKSPFTLVSDARVVATSLWSEQTSRARIAQRITAVLASRAVPMPIHPRTSSQFKIFQGQLPVMHLWLPRSAKVPLWWSLEQARSSWMGNWAWSPLWPRPPQVLFRSGPCWWMAAVRL